MIHTLPPTGYAADVPRPPIGVTIDVPEHWTVLDLDPGTWDTWLDAFLDQRLAGRPNAARERGPARKALLSILRQLHGEKVFLAAILAADVGGDLISASATLAWRQLDLGGDKMNLEGLRRIYARAPASPGEELKARHVELVELPVGGAVKVVSREPMRVPGTKRHQPMYMTQHVIPVLDTNWLAMITTTTPNAQGIQEVADGMANRLSFTRT